MSAARLALSAIKIPKYIERGPTDILRALASTVKHIPELPESSLLDDPFLLPLKFSDKRRYILAKLNGVQAAKFILNKHPELFYRDDAEPKIEAFAPPEEFTSEMVFTEKDIEWCIQNRDPVNGAIAYNQLKEKGAKLRDETLLQFFELICFTNEEAPLDFIEKERSRLVQENDQLLNLAWRNSGLASKIFNDHKEQLDPPRLYSAMIAGLSKYNQHEMVKQLFDEFKTANPTEGLYPCAYRAVLDSIPRLNSSVTTAQEAIDEVVQHMEANLVKPNLMIFNSILSCYQSFNCDDNTCRTAFKLINDMISLRIEPSLFTFTCLFGIVARFRSGNSAYGTMFREMLDHVESNPTISEIRDERDVYFLSYLMSAISSRLNNLKLAKRLHRIYLQDPRLFKSQRFRSRYLNHLFKLMVTTDSLDNILEFYNRYVPMSFQPTIDCYEALVEALDLYQAPDDVVNKIGQDLITFKIAQRIKNDSIFRKDKDYIDGFERLLEDRIFMDNIQKE
mgnify:CR=1 FL=1